MLVYLSRLFFSRISSHQIPRTNNWSFVLRTVKKKLITGKLENLSILAKTLVLLIYKLCDLPISLSRNCCAICMTAGKPRGGLVVGVSLWMSFGLIGEGRFTLLLSSSQFLSK